MKAREEGMLTFSTCLLVWVDVSYVDYYRCVNAKGEEFVPCKQFFRAYNSLCPNEWVSISMEAEDG